MIKSDGKMTCSELQFFFMIKTRSQKTQRQTKKWLTQTLKVKVLIGGRRSLEMPRPLHCPRSVRWTGNVRLGHGRRWGGIDKGRRQATELYCWSVLPVLRPPGYIPQSAWTGRASKCNSLITLILLSNPCNTGYSVLATSTFTRSHVVS